MKLAPIALFTYNRLAHTKATIAALLQNVYAAESDLIVYSDGARDPGGAAKVDVLREYLDSIRGFKSVTVVKREQNFGLAKNIMSGVGEVIDKYGRIIVLEDDLVTAPYFLKFMNEALEKYENDHRVISAVGYIYPVSEQLPMNFFLKNSDCLGWATWKRGWDLFEYDSEKLLTTILESDLSFEFDFGGNYPFTRMLQDQLTGKVDSWAIRWYATAFIHHKLTLYPGNSLVYHAGNDLTGTNYTDDNILDVELYMKPVPVSEIAVEESTAARTAVSRFFEKNYKKNIFQRAFIKVKNSFLK
jgi:hypothetical protein